MTNELPLISVVLPVYNIEQYLPSCMDCMSRQTYTNLELILVDDGSTDRCGLLCDMYAKKDPRIVVYHKSNGGLSDARNYGIERAHGRYIAPIDPDDTVDPDYISYLYQILNRYQARMSLCIHRTLYDNGSIKDPHLHGDEFLETKTCLEMMLYHNVIDTSAWGKLYEKSLFDTVQYPKGKLFEDIGTTGKLMMECEGVACGYETKYTYHFHSHSIVNGAFRPAKFDLIEMTDGMGSAILKQYPDLKEAVLRRRVYARFSVLNQMLNETGYQKEREELISFIRANQKEVMKNRRTPKRDKAAIRLLSLSYPLYRAIWNAYQHHLFGSH